MALQGSYTFKAIVLSEASYGSCQTRIVINSSRK